MWLSKTDFLRVSLCLMFVSLACKEGRHIGPGMVGNDGGDAANSTGGNDGDAKPDIPVVGDGSCGSPNDPRNCGSCGHDCTMLPNVKSGGAGVECRSGSCFVPIAACATGFGHCSTRADDICETNLIDSQNCGACGTKCEGATPLCSMGASGPVCAATCAAGAPDVCGSTCVNMRSDPKNCGTCGHDCGALPNVIPGAAGVACLAGVCSVPPTACVMGFAHCSPRPDEGCEADLANSPNCGGCGTACSGATPLCSTTTGTPKCSASCAGTMPDICGTMCLNLNSDAKNCGTCGHDCTALPNVKPGATGVACQAGTCSVPPTACVSGFGHCSSRPDDGCEADLTRPQTCGQCGKACAAPTALCSTTTSAPTCSSSCVAPSPDLCGTKCVDFKTDPLNCGACGHDCTGLANVKVGASGIECRSSVCYVPPSACTSGFAHCSTKPDDGCETDLTTATNCGKCGTACTAPTALCSTTTGAPMCSSSCVAPSPDLCGARCVDFKSDPLNCGSCGHNCSSLPNVKAGAPVQCVAGVCSIPPTSCASGFAHCAGAADLGCETSLSSPATCGSCTKSCVAPTGLCSTTTGAPMCSSSCVSPSPDLCVTKCVDLKTDAMNCGTCGHDCSTLLNVKPGAPVQCLAGVCSIPPTSCAGGFAHCAGSGDLGCETRTNTATNCGGCGVACTNAPSATGDCSTGTCVQTCMPGFGDCTTAAGCETPLNTPQHCGACPTACSPSSCAVDGQGNVTFTSAGTCSTSRTCVAGTQGTCNGFTCASATACGTTCSGATTGCAAGYFCSGMNCLPKKGVGVSCSTGTECASNACIDNVCCGTACALAASGCMGCSSATTGMPSGTCAPRTGSVTSGCPAANPTMCTNLKTDPNNCNACGASCSSSGLPAGAVRGCLFGSCTPDCTASGSQLCQLDSGTQSCTSMVWGFEPNDTRFWTNLSENNVMLATDRAHTGVGSLSSSPSSNPTTSAANANVQPCFDMFGGGTMDVRGKTFSAWIFVPNAPPGTTLGFGGTRCDLRASDRNFVFTTFGPAASVAPIVPNQWFKLTGVFPGTALESRIVQINVECFVPADWAFDDPNARWSLDDVQIVD